MTAGNEPSSSVGEVTYQSLYRRFRPQRFDEVRGQEHVTHTLRNAVATGRITHAYLFSGPRGTGKTSTTRILAKALNCTESTDGEPCGRCESCLSITAGSSFDVHELDAASNNGVNEIRELVARASLATPGRWKVYIVDEVHMLSTAASNTLLKTLEEPPDHVIFVLATTDPQKVLLTIRSRTQQFEFHLLNEDVLDALLSDVATSAQLALPQGAIAIARRRGKGSARDALTFLDQVTTAGIVEDDSDALAIIIQAIGSSETARAIEALDQALHNGRDPYQVAIELVERLRTGFLRLVAPNANISGLNVVSTTEAAEVHFLGAPRCVRSMELIGAAIVAMRESPDPRITLELALIRLTHPEADESTATVLDRIDRLERRIEGLSVTSETFAESSRPAPTPPAPASPATPRPAPIRSVPGPAAKASPDVSVSDEIPPTPAPSTARENEQAPRPALGAFNKTTTGAAPKVKAPGPSTASRGRKAPEPAQVATSPAGDQAIIAMPSSCDAIVSAWGDHVLIGLRPKVRAYFQVGRFVDVEGEHAVFALPNDAHVAQAEPLCKEVVFALSAHFNRPVGLRLITDGNITTAATPEVSRPTASRDTASIGPFDEETKDTLIDAVYPEHNLALVDTDEGEGDPSLGVNWAKDKLLQAFPGAEELQRP